MKSKKGFTLVEMVLATAISVIVIAAVCTVFYTGMHSATDGTAGSVNQNNAVLLESSLQNNFHSAESITVNTAPPLTHIKGTVPASVYYSNGDFVVEKNGKKQVSVSGIQKLKVSVSGAGNNQKVNYEIYSASGDCTFTLSGGIVMYNIKWSGGSAWDKTIDPTNGNICYMDVPT